MSPEVLEAPSGDLPKGIFDEKKNDDLSLQLDRIEHLLAMQIALQLLERFSSGSPDDAERQLLVMQNFAGTSSVLGAWIRWKLLPQTKLEGYSEEQRAKMLKELKDLLKGDRKSARSAC